MADKTTNRPLFIVFEGVDGSGKSTQIQLLQKRLKELGRKVFTTAEPTSSASGGLIRDALSGSYIRDPYEMAGLFLTDRITHNLNPSWGIKKLLGDGADVISDRYYYSSFAYQGLGTDKKWLMDINLGCPAIRKPDICFFLDINPDKCKARVDAERSHTEIFEEADTLRRIRTLFFDVFEDLGNSENIRVINADRSIQEISDDIFAVVCEMIDLEKKIG